MKALILFTFKCCVTKVHFPPLDMTREFQNTSKGFHVKWTDFIANESLWCILKFAVHVPWTEIDASGQPFTETFYTKFWVPAAIMIIAKLLCFSHLQNPTTRLMCVTLRKRVSVATWRKNNPVFSHTLTEKLQPLSLFHCQCHHYQCKKIFCHSVLPRLTLLLPLIEVGMAGQYY